MRKRVYLDPRHLGFVLYNKAIKLLGPHYWQLANKYHQLDGKIDFLKKSVAIHINSSVYLKESKGVQYE